MNEKKTKHLVLQLLMLQPSVVYTEADPPSLKALATDPYIVVAAGASDKHNTNSSS